MDRIKPDVYFPPTRIWEIQFDSFTLSPSYNIGREGVGNGKGLSVRFPVFKRERHDKTAKEATTANDLIEMYKRLCEQ